MNGPAKRKRTRRWFQFSLASLFLLMTFAVGALVALRAYVAPYDRQRETAVLIERLGGRYRTEEAPQWLSRLLRYDVRNVVSVDLSGSDVPSDYFEAVSRLPRLEVLVIGGPNVGDEHLPLLRRVTTLQWLVLDSAPVTDEAVATLRGALPELSVRRVENRARAAIRGKTTYRLVTYDGVPQPLTDFLPPCEEETHAFTRTDRTNYIERIHGLQFKKNVKLPLADVPGLIVLQDLRLTATRIDDEGLTFIGRVKRLRTLHLSHTKIGDAGLAHLKDLTNLRELRLSKTQVTDAGLVHLRHMLHLEVLDVSNTKVSDVGLAHLERLAELRLLDVVGTQVRPAGIRQLKRTLPQCEMYTD